jgi:hypothetical protein
MLHLTRNHFFQYGSSSLGGYQFVNQEILYLQSFLYTFLYNQYIMQTDELYVINFIMSVLSRFRTNLLAANRFVG